MISFILSLVCLFLFSLIIFLNFKIKNLVISLNTTNRMLNETRELLAKTIKTFNKKLDT